MISWMQKHNRYLVWTIWIATIAFIGAGFVGWGSYKMGSTAGSIAKVGDIEITQVKLNMAYRRIYNQYNEMLQGKLDDKKAKELGIIKKAFSQLETQAKLLNFSNSFGIIVSKEEINVKIHQIKAFQKDNKFNKDFYKRYLSSQRLKPKEFESSLSDDLKIAKLLKLFNLTPLAFELEAISSGMNVSDKIAYNVLNIKDINITIDDKKLKEFWEISKNTLLTDKKYKLSVLWTKTKDTNVTENEIKEFYNANSFNYTDAKGTQLNFEKAKLQATKDLKIKKTKRVAKIQYIAFKNNKAKNVQDMTIRVNSFMFNPTVWKEIESKKVGDLIKPKVVGTRYVSIKINEIIKSRIKTFKEAKAQISNTYATQEKKKELLKIAEKSLKDFNQSSAIISDFIKLDENLTIKSLNKQDSLKFGQKLFTSSKEKGIINVNDSIVVYKIIEQKIAQIDNKQKKLVKDTLKKLKNSTFETNLMKLLEKKYQIQTYREGLTN